MNAFRSALLHQWLIAAAIFVLLLLVWGATRTWVTVQATGGGAADPGGTGARQTARIRRTQAPPRGTRRRRGAAGNKGPG